MTAKIDWYKEVLELEPNSKVFFPLARLLAEDGREDEALPLLEKGLTRHPEYLEARLFLIELLFKSGQREECNRQIESLNRMFAAYAGFWQAWAACLASDQSQSDTASLLRFVAAHFVTGPLKLHEVINRGLDAMLQDGKNTAIDPGKPEPVQTLQAGGDFVSADEDTPDTGSGMEETADSVLVAEDENTDSGAEEAAHVLAADTPEGVLSEEVVEKLADAEMLADLDRTIEYTASAPTEMEAQELVQDMDSVVAESEIEALPDEAAAADVPEVAAAEFAEEAVLANEPDPGNVVDEMVAASVADAALAEAALPEPEIAAELLPATEEAVVAEQEAVLEAELAPEEPALPEPEEDPAVLPVVEDAVPLSAEAATLAAQEEEKVYAAPLTGSPATNLEQAEAEMVDALDLPEMGSAAVEAEAEDSPEEPFSLRTRSMAEVLAEQGDIQGALDIYEELADAATSADEVEDINRRVATLKSRLDMASSSSGFVGRDEKAAEKNREKLLGMLEALAQRVEVRAQ